MESERLIKRTEVAERYGIHPDNVPKMVRAGRIPAPVEFMGQREPRWRESDINQHIRGLRPVGSAGQ